ncbi:hypothetical protein [Mucilaginibacter glaciei]|uniref:ApeI dehydratase-like domain-containing protein n=1 Tax=Mucilaginibacter glaciei TaxID=2772109 RepID=A0A926NTV5_9SPHI|nr:hypothetical protein [Mucilaginibacter glaciei]MBD1391678.1 hypothetical protein [Mucilaginibacter glaciei]
MTLVSENIFEVKDLQQQGGQITATLRLVEDNPILNGHFPGQSVVPGACMLDLVKTVIGDALSINIQLKTAGNIKFMQMVTPADADELNLKITHKPIEAGFISLNATILKAETACFKLQAVFAIL